MMVQCNQKKKKRNAEQGPSFKNYQEFLDCSSKAVNQSQDPVTEPCVAAQVSRCPQAGSCQGSGWSLPALTVDVSALQGTIHLGRRQGDAHEKQDVLQALRVHLAMTAEDLKVAAEGWGGWAVVISCL